MSVVFAVLHFVLSVIPLVLPVVATVFFARAVYSAEKDWRRRNPRKAAAGDGIFLEPYADPSSKPSPPRLQRPRPILIGIVAYILGGLCWGWMFVELLVPGTYRPSAPWFHEPSPLGVAALVMGLVLVAVFLLWWSRWTYGPAWLIAGMMTSGFSTVFYCVGASFDSTGMFGVGWSILIIGMGLIIHPACLAIVAAVRWLRAWRVTGSARPD